MCFEAATTQAQPFYAKAKIQGGHVLVSKIFEASEAKSFPPQNAYHQVCEFCAHFKFGSAMSQATGSHSSPAIAPESLHQLTHTWNIRNHTENLQLHEE